MKKRELGKTGLLVTPIGFGTAQIGYLDVRAPDRERILNGVLDLGINVVDTAACYGEAEEVIGRTISHRRREYVLVTKCGHKGGETPYAEWSPEQVLFSARRSLKRMNTDHLDVLLLHTCSSQHLRNTSMIEALIKCKEDGLARYIGYSGDGEDLDEAIRMGVFDCLETSVNFCDQQVLDQGLPKAASANCGVLAKRPLANTVWRDMDNYGGDYGNYTRVYSQRLKTMGFTPSSIGFEGEWPELAVRFSAHQPGVHCILIGGKNLAHLQADVHLVEKGPLPPPVLQSIRRIWAKQDDGSWGGQS